MGMYRMVEDGGAGARISWGGQPVMWLAPGVESTALHGRGTLTSHRAVACGE